MLLIGDHNSHEIVGDGKSVMWKGERRYFGLLPRKTPYGKLSCASASTLEPIELNELCDRIEQKDKDKSWPYDIWKKSKIGVLDQNGLSYCHAFSCTDALMIARQRQGLPYVQLSAGSIGGPVTGFRNAGAAIEDDLRQAKDHGAASTEFVPMQSHSKSDWKEGAAENAMLHRVTLWWDLNPREMLLEYLTAILESHPVCFGYDWWSHAVTGGRLAPVSSMSDLRDAIKSGSTSRILAALKTQILNSWGEKYGEGGWGWITGGKQVPNEAYVPAMATQSNN